MTLKKALDLLEVGATALDFLRGLTTSTADDQAADFLDAARRIFDQLDGVQSGAIQPRAAEDRIAAISKRVTDARALRDREAEEKLRG